VVFVGDITSELWWCNSHQRQATHIQYHKGYRTLLHCCDPKLGGIMLPCDAVNLTGEAQLEKEPD